MTESFAQLFEESLATNDMRQGTILKGLIVDIRNDAVVVNAGLKSEGSIPIDQFYNEKGELEINVGDEVDVALESLEDGYGETRLSREKAKRAEAWTFLEKAQEEEEIVTGIISGIVASIAVTNTGKPSVLIVGITSQKGRMVPTT